MIALDEVVKPRSGPIVTFHPASPKRRQRKGLRSRGRPDEPYLMHARYYSSSLGRFVSGDPSLKVGKNLAIPQRWNRYTYSLNNPIKYADPDGRDIALSTDGNSCVTYGMMVQAAMRPTSRGALQSMAANTGATFTFADARINPPGQVQGIMAAAATGTMSVPDVDDASTRVTNTTTSAQTGATHYDIEIKLDTSAIQQVNTDPSGASTIGHESVHAQDLATGMDPEIAALNEPQAEARGEQVRRENADISPEQAKAAVDKMLEKK